MFDFIGDIHGHADKLSALLKKLDYSYTNGTYKHSERKAFFVGDYIDRGPKIKETLEIVRGMQESGNSIALMGNHEYNALCFNLLRKEGGHVRKHKIQNIIQHYKTLKAFQNLDDTYFKYLVWFKTLPVFYETEEFRAVHACWDQNNIDFLKNKLTSNLFTDDTIYESSIKGSQFYHAIEDTLKGKEITLPNSQTFLDKDKTLRRETRIKWWEDPSKMTYRKISVLPLKTLKNDPIDLSQLNNSEYYRENEKPIFFGHYWLKGSPSIYRENVVCLDYSVAKRGKLVAYRFDGENELNNSKLIYV